MEKFEPINLVQQSRKAEANFDLLKFTILLNRLTPEQFNQFCNSVIRLTEFHDTNRGAICTDQTDNLKDLKESWTLE